MITVAFCGQKGSGKSYAAELIKDHSNVFVKEVSFARHLKETIALLDYMGFGEQYWNVNLFDHPDLKDKAFIYPLPVRRGFLEDVCELFSIASHVYNPALDKIMPTLPELWTSPRHILQVVGTDVIRAIRPTAHTDIAIGQLDSQLNVVADLRFLNELSALSDWQKAAPGRELVTVFIERTDAPLKQDSHISEVNARMLRTQSDIVIHNPGTREGLFKNLQMILGPLLNELECMEG